MERRAYRRYELTRDVVLETDGGTIPATVIDISPSGAKIAVSAGLSPGGTVTLDHVAAGRLAGVVTKVLEDGVVVQFETDASSATFVLRFLTSHIDDSEMGADDMKDETLE